MVNYFSSSVLKIPRVVLWVSTLQNLKGRQSRKYLIQEGVYGSKMGLIKVHSSEAMWRVEGERVWRVGSISVRSHQPYSMGWKYKERWKGMIRKRARNSQILQDIRKNWWCLRSLITVSWLMYHNLLYDFQETLGWLEILFWPPFSA